LYKFVLRVHITGLSQRIRAHKHAGQALSRCSCIRPRAMVFGEVIHYIATYSFRSRIQ